MMIPRWLVYPSLALIGGSLLMAIPTKSGGDPYSGAAMNVAESEDAGGVRKTDHPEMIVLGIDGMDPELLAEAIKLYPERMPNFRWLLEQADGITSLGTSTPPQSPVAWSNFITGMNPGGHGIYDFIHRDYVTRAGIGSSAKLTAGDNYELPGPWFVNLGAGAQDNRTGRAFWSILQDEGIAADIWRMPVNFPVIESKGLSFPGMLTPAVDSAYGECSFYTTDDARYVELNTAHPGNASKVNLVTERGGTIATSLRGPVFTNKHYKDDPSKNYSRVPLKVNVDLESKAAVFEIGGQRVILQPGQWSQFIPVNFSLLPMGMADAGGICRFYLRSIEPEVEFYISPINFDPAAPGTPVSAPAEGSVDLAAKIGSYYTQGMAEDVNSLKNEVLTDAEFMAQTDLVYGERRDMLEYAFDRYLEEDEGGLLFFYFSTVDLCSHMMWRHKDASHPAHDPELAAQDSSWWSKREGSTWADTIHELYVKMDPVIGYIRERMSDEATLVVMSDHGFAPYRRKFSLNTWLLENGYLVLQEGVEKELPKGHEDYKKIAIDKPGIVDWSKTRAYGMGFNGLYLNLEGRELDNPETDEDESGIVTKAEADALLKEIKAKLEEFKDSKTGVNPVRRCDLASVIYSGPRVAEAPDMLVGFSAGYGNSDQSSLGRITNQVLLDNTGGTFNGSHLMAPEVVSGILISNKPIRDGEHQLEDLTVEILDFFGVQAPDNMHGHPVLKR